ncbi:hypothetical protein AAC387_Pa09g1454 [Persea americana]
MFDDSNHSMTLYAMVQKEYKVEDCLPTVREQVNLSIKPASFSIDRILEVLKRNYQFSTSETIPPIHLFPWPLIGGS